MSIPVKSKRCNSSSSRNTVHHTDVFLRRIKLTLMRQWRNNIMRFIKTHTRYSIDTDGRIHMLGDLNLVMNIERPTSNVERLRIIIICGSHRGNNDGAVGSSAIQTPEPLKDRGHVCGQIAFPFHFFPCDGMNKLQTGGVKHLSSNRYNCMSNPEFRWPTI